MSSFHMKSEDSVPIENLNISSAEMAILRQTQKVFRTLHTKNDDLRITHNRLCEQYAQSRQLTVDMKDIMEADVSDFEHLHPNIKLLLERKITKKLKSRLDNMKETLEIIEEVSLTFKQMSRNVSSVLSKYVGVLDLEAYSTDRPLWPAASRLTLWCDVIVENFRVYVTRWTEVIDSISHPAFSLSASDDLQAKVKDGWDFDATNEILAFTNYFVNYKL